MSSDISANAYTVVYLSNYLGTALLAKHSPCLMRTYKIILFNSRKTKQPLDKDRINVVKKIQL